MMRKIIIGSILYLSISFVGMAQENSAYTLTDKDVIVFEGVIENCFYDFKNTDIIIPEWLDKQYVIGIKDMKAFAKKGITSVQLPNTLEFIGRAAFGGNKLKKVVIPSKVTRIAKQAFVLNQISSLELPDSLASIGHSAFSGNNLTSIQYSKFTNVSALAFSYNKIVSINGVATKGLIFKKDSLGNEDKTVLVGYWGASRTIDFLPSTIDTIADEVFFKQNLLSLTLPQGIKHIGALAFGENLISQLRIPSSVTTIERYAFKDNKISKLELKEGLKFIGHDAFQRNKITHLNLPNSLEVIDSDAFQYNSISQVVLSKNLRKVESDAFGYNPIKYLNLPKSSNLNFVEWRNEDDELISKPIEIESDYDCYYAWYKDSLKLEDVEFEEGVIKKIVNRNNRYRYLIVPDSLNGQAVTVIGDVAFGNCKLYSVSLPNTLERIEDSAFVGLDSLSEITIPESVVFIGKNAFYHAGFKTYKLPQSKDPNFLGWFYEEENSDYRNSETKTIACGKEMATDLWNKPLTAMFKSVVTIDDIKVENGVIIEYTGQEKFVRISAQINGQEITGIGPRVFADKGLCSVFISKNIKKIDKEAFANNTLKEVEFEPQSLLSYIGKGAFAGNSDLKQIVLPSSGLSNYKNWKSISNHIFAEGDAINNLFMRYQVEFK
jgi:hypothetical protein